MTEKTPNQGLTTRLKVHPLKSLRAKLFYAMSLLVLITVAGNSFQYIKTFMAYQTQQVQDTITLQAEKVGVQVENTVDTWRSQIAVALPTLKGTDAQSTSEQARRFIDSSPEFVSFSLMSAPTAKSTVLTTIGESFTSNTTDPRFEDKLPSKVQEKVRAVAKAWLKKQIPKIKKSNFAIESIAKSTELPIMLVAIRFEVAGSQQVIWGVLAAWQTSLINALPKSKFVDSAVIDPKGKIFTSPNIIDMVQRKKFSGAQLAKSALTGSSPSGFEQEYRDSENRRRLGAFSRLPKYNLAILVETDHEVAYQALKKNMLSTGLWAIFFILIAIMFSYVVASSITKALRAVTFATSRIAAGDFKTPITPSSEDEVGMLGHAVNHMSRQIVTLLHSQVDKARFEKELETAKMVQSTFFPKSDIKQGSFSVTGFYQPASECGGDLWGHFTIDDGVEFVFIADAMGHGAPAALVTAMAYSTTMTIADIIKSNPEFRDSPAKILDRANRIIYEAVRGTISMTFFASIIDTKRGTLTYSNAGHNFPLLVPAKAGDARAGKAKVAKGGIQPISLKLMSTPLGMDPETTYKEQSIELRAGDKFFYFTDGLIECSSPKGEVWGRKYLVEQIASTASMSAEEMKDEVLGRAFQFFAQKPLDDDVTVVVAELDKAWEPARETPPKATTKAQEASPQFQIQATPARGSQTAQTVQAPVAQASQPVPPRPPQAAAPGAPQPAPAFRINPTPAPQAAPRPAQPAPAPAPQAVPAQAPTPGQFSLKQPGQASQPRQAPVQQQPTQPKPAEPQPAPAPASQAPVSQAPHSQAPTSTGKGNKYKIKLPSAS